MAPVGHSAALLEHASAENSPALMEHLIHRLLCQTSWGLGERFSGLQHQGQRKGQPFTKTTVRIPPPSCREKRWTLVMVAVVTLFSPAYSTCSVRLIMSS